MNSNEWQLMTFKEICSKIGSGATPTGGASAYETSGTTLIRSQNVLDFSFSMDGLAFINDTQAKKLNGVTVNPGDVLLNITGDSVARACIVPSDILPARVNQHVSIIRVDDQKADNSFVFYFLEKIKPLLLASAGIGCTRNALTKAMIEALEILLPPLPEQRAIARILSSLDDKIELNNRMNKTLEEMAQAIFKRWFVDFDFPDENGNPYKSSGGKMVEREIGLIPEGWKVGTAKNVLLRKTDNCSSTAMASQTPYIGLEHMPQHSIALNNWGDSDEVTSAKSCFIEGDILFGKLRPYFHKVGVAPISGICSTDILVLNTKLPKYYGFSICLASSDDFVRFADAASEGTKMPRAKWSHMETYILPIPNQIIAEQFDKIIRPMIKQILVNIHENRILSQVRDTLLPRLMSGDLRVATN